MISVIIPTYNRDNVLPRAIESVVHQTYVDWELVIVDDGSTDNTKAVVEEFLTDQRIRYVLQENKGVSAARNYGAEKASGEYLIFLDSDDLLEISALSSYFELIDHSELLIVFGKFRKSDKILRGCSKRNFLFNNLSVNNMAGAFCIQKVFFESIGRYDRCLSHSENWELMIRVCHSPLLSKKSVGYIDASVLTYNDWINRAKIISNKKKKLDSYRILYEKYLLDNSYDNRFSAYFAHILANNYAGLGCFQETLKWILNSTKLECNSIIYWFKPIGIYLKRRVFPY